MAEGFKDGGNIFRGKAGGTGDKIYPVIMASTPIQIQRHEGNAYIYITNASLAAGGNTVLIRVVTGGIDVHFDHLISGDKVSRVEIFETPTTSADGTIGLIHNLNRNSSKVSTVSCYLTPTVTSPGNLLGSLLIDSAIGKRDEGEIILKQDTIYLIRVTAISSNSEIAVELIWYEEN